MTRTRRTPKPEELLRFRDLPRDGAEAGLSALFRAVGEPGPLERAELAEVRRQLIRKERAPGRRRARESLMIAAALFSGVGVAFGALGVAEWARAPARPSVAERVISPAARLGRTPSSRRQELPATSESAAPSPMESEAPAPGAERTPPRAPGARFQDSRSPAETEASSQARTEANALPARSALALESESLGHALVALRRDHDAAAALALLDAHEAAYPAGALALEARVARVDALVALRRKSDALAVLARLPLDRVGRGAELRLLRAELTAERDCAAAFADLDALIASALAGVRERALYARASCRFRVGDHAGAEQDLRRYLADYPRGRFASEVQERLH